MIHDNVPRSIHGTLGRVDKTRQNPAKEIERLQSLAAWYRNWAELAGNAGEREARLRLAEYIESRARALKATND